MMKSKIYFGKSNRANPNHVMAVRALLSEYGEVVEYTGGAYSHQPMLECDYLVILPELNNPRDDKEFVNLGRGLHDQIESFMGHNNCKSDLLIINEVNQSSKDFWVGNFDELDIADYDDYINHSCALFNYDKKRENLKSILDNRIGKVLTTSDIDSDYMYLLIDTIK